MSAAGLMVSMRALETAARRKGSGLVWLWAGEVADLTPVQWDGPVLPWFGGRPLITNAERRRILAELAEDDEP